MTEVTNRVAGAPKRIVFVLHPHRPDADLLAARAGKWLVDRGNLVTMVDTADPTTSSDMNGIDLAVSLGGDGTMLRTLELANVSRIPVLGVNLGRLGYLTEVEPVHLESSLARFIDGDFDIEERMTLEVTVFQTERTGLDSSGNVPAIPVASKGFELDLDGHPGKSYIAVNDAVVEKTVPGHTIRVETAIAGRAFVTYSVDGILVATPTGSTAYNMSARGPIVSPNLQAIVLTPISPHMLFDRPMVLGVEEWVQLNLVDPRRAVLVVDGVTVADLQPGDAVICRAGPHPARLITFGERDVHAVLRSRFNLADR